VLPVAVAIGEAWATGVADLSWHRESPSSIKTEHSTIFLIHLERRVAPPGLPADPRRTAVLVGCINV
jgi:hypothetical protein